MENAKVVRTEEFNFTVNLDTKRGEAFIVYGGYSVVDFSKFKSLTITCVGCGKVIAIPINAVESFYHKCAR